MKTITKALFLAVVVFMVCSVFAQTADVVAKPLTDDDITLLRKDIQREKTDLITETMQFSKAESDAFWPVYKEYATAQHAVNDTKLAVLTDYAKSLDKMDSAKAHDLTVRIMKVEEDALNLKRSYLPKFEKAIGGVRAAKFFQVDSRMTALLNLQLAAEAPLIP